MAAQIIKFIARRTRLRLREARRVAQFINRYGQYIPPTPAEAEHLRQKQLEHRRRDWEWSRRHGPIEGGGLLVAFNTDGDVAESPECGLAERREEIVK
jgi:hypothetical protein